MKNRYEDKLGNRDKAEGDEEEVGGSEKGDEGTSIKLHENGWGGLWQKQI